MAYGKQMLRRRGVWSDRVRGGQPGIGGSIQRRVASEGSLSLTVVVIINAEWRWRGGEWRGENERSGKGGGVESGRFSRG